MMPTTIPSPPEIGGVEATRTGKGNPSRNVGIVATKATRRVSAGRGAPTRRKPDLDPEKLKNEISSGRTTPKDPKKLERGSLHDGTQNKLDEEDLPEIGQSVVR